MLDFDIYHVMAMMSREHRVRHLATRIAVRRHNLSDPGMKGWTRNEKNGTDMKVTRKLSSYLLIANCQERDGAQMILEFNLKYPGQ